MSTADNFPALDLVDGNVRMRSRTTGNALDDLNAFDNALDAGERIDINIDGGTVYQVKSRAVSASEVVRQTTRDISNLASRSEEHTSELQSLMRISYAGFCLK